MAAHVWNSLQVSSELPPDAVIAGHDSDGSQIYVGRAYHDGDILVAKYVPSRQQAYVCFSGEEIEKHDVDVLCGKYYKWVPASEGFVPDTAVCSGMTADGEPLYIGRAHWEGSLTPGKIHRSHGCLYIAYGGAEHSVSSYEVLVQPETFISTNADSIPENAIEAGHDEDGSPIFLGRSWHEGEQLPVKVCPNQGKGYVAFGGGEHEKFDFEVLVGNGYGWVSCSDGNIPPKAPHAGQTSSGETLYFGRGHHSNSLVPGKVHPSHGCLYIPFGGQEIKLSDYEVLVRV